MSTQKEVKFADKQKFDLLEQVQKEPMLWDRQCDGFKLKDAKAAKWNEIAKSAGYPTGKKASDAWQVLKDEYTKQRKKQSGEGAKVTWKFFESMAFYSGVCEPRAGQSSTFAAQQSASRADASGSRQLADDDYDLDEENDLDSVLGEFSASPSTPGTAPGKKRKLSVELQILKTLERSQKDLEATMAEEADENIAFGKSIGLSLQKLPDQQANWARMQMSNVLYQAQCWQHNAVPPAQVNPSNVLHEIHYNNENDGDILFPTQPSLLSNR